MRDITCLYGSSKRSVFDTRCLQKNLSIGVRGTGVRRFYGCYNNVDQMLLYCPNITAQVRMCILDGIAVSLKCI